MPKELEVQQYHRDYNFHIFTENNVEGGRESRRSRRRFSISNESLEHEFILGKVIFVSLEISAVTIKAEEHKSLHPTMPKLIFLLSRSL